MMISNNPLVNDLIFIKEIMAVVFKKLSLIFNGLIFVSAFLVLSSVQASEFEQTQLALDNKTSNTALDVQWFLSSEQWDLARRGEMLLKLEVLNTVINHWLKTKNKMIELQYPGGEEGELWVNELKNWLVALGVPSNYLLLSTGSTQDDMISFYIVQASN